MTLEDLKDFIGGFSDWEIDSLSGNRWMIGKVSWLEEDFSFVVTHNGDPERVLQEIFDFAWDFDANEHAEAQANSGASNSMNELIEDAEWIQTELEDLYNACVYFWRGESKEEDE